MRKYFVPQPIFSAVLGPRCFASRGVLAIRSRFFSGAATLMLRGAGLTWLRSADCGIRRSKKSIGRSFRARCAELARLPAEMLPESK